eukprot:Nitzschia sp. Nitz4//scaffold245_size28976//2505//3458//NITZ4_008069-RA/size28976-augustus-gene-0.0-mRNA-1//1//CDS//3329543872//8675//frame0
MTFSDAWVDFIAGWGSGAAAVVACQPVDTLLTRVQAGEQLVMGGNASTNLRVQARGLMSDFGFTSLWRGSSAMIGAVPLQNAMLMGGYGIGKQWAADDSNSTGTLLSVFVGGLTGGLVQSFLMSPVELVKVSQQVNVSKGVRSASQEVLRGWSSSSWRGLNATLLRDGIPHGVWFASYEVSKDALSQHVEDDSFAAKVQVPIIAGAVAATVAWAVGYPFDIIKTRIQARPLETNRGIYGTAVELIRESNGKVIPALYRGFGLKLVRAVPASMIGFLTYETIADSIRGS